MVSHSYFDIDASELLDSDTNPSLILLVHSEDNLSIVNTTIKLTVTRNNATIRILAHESNINTVVNAPNIIMTV